MKRIVPLSLFLMRDLFLSLSGLVIPAAGLTFYEIAFQYGMDQPQFTTVTGVALGALGTLTVLLLAARASRASFYPLVARLRYRGELLAAIVASSLVITAVVGVLMTAAALLRDQLTLSWPSALWIVPTWLVLWTMMAALGLLLSGLTSRDGTHLIGYVLLTALLVANDRRWQLDKARLGWLNKGVAAVLWPTTTLLARATAGTHDRAYFLALALTLAYAAVLFALAVQLFEHKDLIWPE